MKNFFKFKKPGLKIDDSLHRYDAFDIRMDFILNKRRFIDAVHLRCPFEVSFITFELLIVTYHIGLKTYSFEIQVSEFEEIMSYALMHIDDIV